MSEASQLYSSKHDALTHITYVIPTYVFLEILCGCDALPVTTDYTVLAESDRILL